MSRFDRDPREIQRSFSQRLTLNEQEAVSIDNLFALRYAGGKGKGWGQLFIAVHDSTPIVREQFIDKVSDRKAIVDKISLVRVPIKLGQRLQKVFIGEYTLSVRNPHSKNCTIEVASSAPIETIHLLPETELREYVRRVSRR